MTRMPSRSTQTVIGIFLGLAVGLFFGEDVAFFGLFAASFIGLLQMAVMPFVVCSIIYSFGSLSAQDLARLFRISAPIMALLWGTGLLAVGLFSAALPSLSFGSFFSASLVQSPPPFDWVRLFIPSDIFDALAENLVPAVVVFSRRNDGTEPKADVFSLTSMRLQQVDRRSCTRICAAPLLGKLTLE